MRPSAAPRSPGGSTFVTETLASAGIAAPPAPCTIRPKTSATKTRRPSAEEAPSSESKEPYHESAADTEHVRSPPVERDADRVGQQVACDHPPDLSLCDAVVASYNRNHDIDHRAVEHGDEDGGDQNPYQEPPGNLDLLCHYFISAQTGAPASSDAASARLDATKFAEPTRNVPPIPQPRTRSPNANALIISKIWLSRKVYFSASNPVVSAPYPDHNF